MDTGTRILALRRLGVATVALTFLLMVAGSWVKATGSGLACPDWPQCYGEWLPPFPSSETGATYEGEPVHFTQAQILYEWGHRGLAALVGPVLLAAAFIAARGRDLHPTLRWLPVGAVAVLGLQIGIGAATVMQGNPAATTTLHLATATLFFLLVTIATCFAFLRPLEGRAMVPVRREPGVVRMVYPGERDG